jgi:WD40 repeat protein
VYAVTERLAPRGGLGPVPRAARGAALAPDGRGAAVLAADRAGGVEAEQVVLLAVPGEVTQVVDTRLPRGRGLVFSPDGETLLVGDVSGSVRTVSLLHPPAELAKAPRFGDPLDGEVEALAFSPDATTLLVLEGTSAGARLLALRWPSGSLAWRSPQVGKARWLAWSPDGALVAVGHEDGAVTVWAAPP